MPYNIYYYCTYHVFLYASSLSLLWRRTNRMESGCGRSCGNHHYDACRCYSNNCIFCLPYRKVLLKERRISRLLGNNVRRFNYCRRSSTRGSCRPLRTNGTWGRSYGSCRDHGCRVRTRILFFSCTAPSAFPDVSRATRLLFGIMLRKL